MAAPPDCAAWEDAEAGLKVVLPEAGTVTVMTFVSTDCDVDEPPAQAEHGTVNVCVMYAVLRLVVKP